MNGGAAVLTLLLAYVLTIHVYAELRCSDSSDKCVASQSADSAPAKPSSMLQVSMGRAAASKAASVDDRKDPNLVAEHSIDTVATTLNSTASDLFEKLRQNCEKTYPQYGRIPDTDPSEGSVSIDFEFETRATLKLTPEIALERGGITRKMLKKSSNASSTEQGAAFQGLHWPKVSKWFKVGLDGSGFVGSLHQWRQSMAAVVELESVVMSPSDAINSNFTKDITRFLERIVEERNKSGNVFSLPFPGSKGIHISARGLIGPTKNCTGCNIQWTVGLSLRHVSSLLRLSPHKPWQDAVARADTRCSEKQTVCRPEYHALITLAAVTLQKVRHCGCGHPKRYSRAWLVRTHFGDLAMWVKSLLGEHEFASIAEDIMFVGDFKGDDKLLPKGIIDYLRFPEMAELSGMVTPRLQNSSEPDNQDIPSDYDGLLITAKKVLDNRRVVRERLQRRPCQLHNSSSLVTSDITVKDWLDGMLAGKDLTSDHDSELSKVSFSHLVWKSMGSWRMKPGIDRVYLECRRTYNCLSDITPQTGPAGLMQLIARRMQDFEDQMKSSPPPTDVVQVSSI